MARGKDLAGLAALGALGYMMSKGKGGEDVPVDDRTGTAPAAEEAAPVAPLRTSSRVRNAGQDMREPPHIDAEAGMTRGTRPRDARDAEAGNSRGMRNRAGAGRGVTVPTGGPQVDSTTEAGMRNYKPRYTPSPMAPAAREGARPAPRLNAQELDDYSTYKKGGKVSSASRRADGIASRGKTRGKMV